MNQSQLLYTVKGNTAQITINRQEQGNSINPEVISLFLECLDEAERDDQVRVILVTAAGDKVFCAGADLGNVFEAREDIVTPFKNYARLITRLATYPKPTVARVQGSCVAGGTGFMLACDIVIASTSAKFGTPEVNVGLFPVMIGPLIFENVPRKKAMEMILLGKKLCADEALEMGLITRAVEPDDLDNEVTEVISKLESNSPIGMKIGKESFNNASEMSFKDALEYLSTQLLEVVSTQDAREGITAFLEKRKPKFIGK